MKKLVVFIFIFLLGGLVGSQFSAIKDQVMGSNTGDESAEKKPLYWVAPMDKNYRRDDPGKSPMGMDLIPVYAEANNDESSEGDVYISAAVENNLGVRTAEVSRSNLYQAIDTVGTVQFDESQIKHFHSRVDGWIEVLNVSAVGDSVKKGQVLYELYSPTLVNAQEEYLAALRSANSNLIKASKSRLLSLGLDERQAQRLEQRRKVDQRVKVIAENDGVVLNLMVREGMFIKPATEVLSIGSLDSVWVLGEVFERQSYLVNLGQTVDISFNAMPGEQWQSKLSFIYPELDASTRTLMFRVNIDNPDHILKPNMLANLRISSNNKEPSISIPKQALIKASGHNRVVKALGDGKFQSVLVDVGFEGLENGSDESKIQILKGLSEGDRVVTSAQFLIDSESNIDAELSRINNEEQQIDIPETNSVMSKGTINSVMTEHMMLNITHEPIPEWEWPMMRMDFDVNSSVDMSHLKIGDQINFTIMKQTDGGISIIKLNVQDSTNSVMNGQAVKHSGMSQEEMNHDH